MIAKKPGKSFIRTATLALLLTAILPIVIFYGFWTYHEFQRYGYQTEKLKTEFTERNKKYLRNKVGSVVNMIEHELTLIKTEEIANIQAQALEAYRIAVFVKKQASVRGNGENVQRAILEALKFAHSQSKTFNLIILDAFGNRLLSLGNGEDFPTFRESASVGWNNELNRVLGPDKLKREGYVKLPETTNDQAAELVSRRAYIKKLESLNWTFISFGSVSSTYASLRKNLIRRIGAMKPISSHYFFIVDEFGRTLLGPYTKDNLFELKDIQGNKIRPALMSIKESGGGFIKYVLQKQPEDYTGPKLSYVVYNSTLRWYIGTGMLFRELDRALAEKKHELEVRVRNFTFEGLALLAILLVVIIFLERVLTHKVRRDLDKLKKIMEGAITDSEQLEDSQLYFKESRQMVHNTNHFIRLRVESEAELRKSELKYRMLFENLRDGLVEADIREKMVEVNPTFCDMMGYSKSELLKLSINDLTVENWGDLESMEVISQIEKQGYSRNYELRFLRKDGSFFPAEVQFYTVRDESGNIVGFRAIIRDISKRKDAEKRESLHQKQLIQADKMISLGILTSGVAHEINNPNQFIMTHCTLIRDIWQDAVELFDQYAEINGDFILNRLPYSVLREKVPLFFKNIEKGSRRIQNIVSELKEFARDYSHNSVELVDINSIVASGITLVDHLIKKSTHNFKVTFGKDLPLFWGHYQHLEQVIINLLQNACQSLADMNNRIDLETYYAEANNRLIVSITDEGCGIREKDLEHITDPFFTTRREEGGTGLGLSISDKIVKEHDGALLFTSMPGGGTKVTLSLPVEKRKTA